jgi:glucose-1-phosphate adenylyltransferase
MAASTCVSTSCSSVSGARKSLIYGRQPLGRSVFFYGKRVSVTGSLQGAQQWLSTAHAVSKSSKRSLIVTSSSLLAEISSQTVAPAMQNRRADPRKVVSIILGGGAGTRLFPLTKRRAKPAVPIGGAYRLIDVPMSNCINSGINKVFILTQFNSTSLNRHLARTYSFGNGVNLRDGFVEVLAATQTPGEGGNEWFQGTADAVRQYLWLFEDAKNQDVENVLILSGDHLYRMDYMDFVQLCIRLWIDEN